MTISNFCVGFVVFIVLLVITGLLGLLNMIMADEENLFCDIYCLDCIYSWFSNMSDLYFSYESFYLGRCRKDE